MPPPTPIPGAPLNPISGAALPPPPPGDPNEGEPGPFQLAAEAWTDLINDVTGIFRDLTGGKKSPTDAVTEAMKVGRDATVAAGGIVGWWGRALGVLPPKTGDPLDTSKQIILQQIGPPQFSAVVTVPSDLSAQTLTLQTEGGRLEPNLDAVLIPSHNVTFDPPVITPGLTSFTVRVGWQGVEQKGIFSVEITAAEINGRVIATVYPPC